MARPYWSGQIQISLVSFGVSLFPATNAASQVRLYQIDRKSGERIHHRNVKASDAEGSGTDAGDDGEAMATVEKADIIKGYEYRKGEYVTLEPDELAKLRIPGKKVLSIAQFVDTGELQPALFEKPYFVVPQNETQVSAFAVVREALKQTGKAGLGEIAFSGREHLIALTAAPGDSRGMMAYTLRYDAELRSSAECMAGIAETKIDKDQLSLAKELIQRNTSAFDPRKYKDDYESALRELLDAKVHHLPLAEVGEEQPKRAKPANLMEALRRSLSAVPAPSASAAKGKKPAASETSAGARAAIGSASGASHGKKGIRLVKPPSPQRRKSA